MIKIVVFDSGYGGELLADSLEEEFPTYKIIRVIDWRHASQILKSPKEARRAALKSLRPYINKVDVIVLANFLLSITSLEYFRKKFPDQKFVGLHLPKLRFLDGHRNRRALVLSTRALSKTIAFKVYLFKAKLISKVKVENLDCWVDAIDDGELTESQIRYAMSKYQDFQPNAIIAACAQFIEIEPKLKQFFNRRVKVFKYHEDVISEIKSTLKIYSYQKKTSGLRSRQMAPKRV